jgi:dCMP deaminase
LQCAKYGISVSGADLYVTHFPCLPCTKSIIQAGISRLYYAQNYKNNEYALKLLSQASVEIIQVPFDERKIDFLSDEKVALYMELISKLREKGASKEELAPYETKVTELFGL